MIFFFLRSLMSTAPEVCLTTCKKTRFTGKKLNYQSVNHRSGKLNVSTKLNIYGSVTDPDRRHFGKLVRIRIHIKVESLIRIRIEVESWIRTRIKVESWIRIRIKVKTRVLRIRIRIKVKRIILVHWRVQIWGKGER
jgi:hypothetical protein